MTEVHDRATAQWVSLWFDTKPVSVNAIWRSYARGNRVATIKSQVYRDFIKDAGAEPGDIQTVADLEKLPILLHKDDERILQEASRAELGHPFGEHLCAPLESVVSVASTSGTTGVPTFYAFTANDVATTDELWGRAFRFAGRRSFFLPSIAKPSDLVSEVAVTRLLSAPKLDGNLWELMVGMLGMGALRSFEKFKGVASK